MSRPRGEAQPNRAEPMRGGCRIGVKLPTSKKSIRPAHADQSDAQSPHAVATRTASTAKRSGLAAVSC